LRKGGRKRLLFEKGEAPAKVQLTQGGKKKLQGGRGQGASYKVSIQKRKRSLNPEKLKGNGCTGQPLKKKKRGWDIVTNCCGRGVRNGMVTFQMSASAGGPNDKGERSIK